jgi:hypothetical protein
MPIIFNLLLIGKSPFGGDFAPSNPVMAMVHPLQNMATTLRTQVWSRLHDSRWSRNEKVHFIPLHKTKTHGLVLLSLEDGPVLILRPLRLFILL